MNNTVRDDLPEHDVAITVFCRTRGVNAADAADGAAALIRLALHEAGDHDDQLRICRIRGHRAEVDIVEVIETGRAAANGYLWALPTAKSFLRLGPPQ